MNVTKKQVAKKINKLIKDYTKQLIHDVTTVLDEADMWYGECNGQQVKITKKLDRNADLLVLDGPLDNDNDIDKYLHAASELNRK